MLRTCVLVVSAALAAHGVWAADAAKAPDTQAQVAPSPESASQQMARTVLGDMAKLLGGTEKFSAKLRVGYDVVQENGQKIEFGEIRELAVQRPNRLRIEEVASDGGRDLVVFDGAKVSVLDGDTGLYAQGAQPGDIDASVVYFVRDLKMRLPLAPLLMSHLHEELTRRVQSIEYVERTEILGQPTHHIAARTATVDFQVWVAEGAQPLPLRIVLSYPSGEGQPQFWANFSNWNLAPQFAEATFAFTPPAGATQIMFAAQVLPPADGARK